VDVAKEDTEYHDPLCTNSKKISFKELWDALYQKANLPSAPTTLIVIFQGVPESSELLMLFSIAEEGKWKTQHHIHRLP
jgi:hypothetical protein